MLLLWPVRADLPLLQQGWHSGTCFIGWCLDILAIMAVVHNTMLPSLLWAMVKGCKAGQQCSALPTGPVGVALPMELWLLLQAALQHAGWHVIASQSCCNVNGWKHAL